MTHRPNAPHVNLAPRRDRLLVEYEHDTYKLPGKLPDPTACPGCGAMFRGGRWRWGAAPADAHETMCPACHRIADDYPAGYLTLSGPFLGEHREEILGIARNVEKREQGEHPLKRIMAIRDDGDELSITTTDPKLARSIGDAIHRAYEGHLDYRYAHGEHVLRVRWRR